MNFEYRVPDASSNPFLLIAALVTAGCSGLADPGPLHYSQGVDPEKLDLSDRKAQGIQPLPDSMESALDSLLGDIVMKDAVPPLLLQCYCIIKRDQIAKAKQMDAGELTRLYEKYY